MTGRYFHALFSGDSFLMVKSDTSVTSIRVGCMPFPVVSAARAYLIQKSVCGIVLKNTFLASWIFISVVVPCGFLG